MGCGRRPSESSPRGTEPSQIVGSEHSIWLQKDPHATKAYTVLFNDASKRIFKYLQASPRYAEQLKAAKYFRSQLLLSELNPHFIFNALNSIQYYINRNDKQAANKYLTSFAKLMRKNLDSSQDTQSTLADELVRLRLYIELEHMRFKEKFTYQINVEPGINAETIQIPAMLLHPYVENSIWHGILPSEKQGEVTVDVRKLNNNGSIEIVIRDNGIGIDTSIGSKSDASRSHDSKGMKITHSRIDLLRKMTNKRMFIEGPSQLIANNKSTGGTEVRIILHSKEEAVLT